MAHSPLTRVGLGLLAVSATLDLLLPLTTDGKHPPMPIALAASILGLASLFLVLSVWRGAGRALPWLLVLRIPTLSAVPGLFGSDDPVAAKVSGAIAVVFAAAGAVMVLRGRHAEQTLATSR